MYFKLKIFFNNTVIRELNKNIKIRKLNNGNL